MALTRVNPHPLTPNVCPNGKRPKWENQSPLQNYKVPLIGEVTCY